MCPSPEWSCLFTPTPPLLSFSAAQKCADTNWLNKIRTILIQKLIFFLHKEVIYFISLRFMIVTHSCLRFDSPKRITWCLHKFLPERESSPLFVVFLNSSADSHRNVPLHPVWSQTRRTFLRKRSEWNTCGLYFIFTTNNIASLSFLSCQMLPDEQKTILGLMTFCVPIMLTTAMFFVFLSPATHPNGPQLWQWSSAVLHMVIFPEVAVKEESHVIIFQEHARQWWSCPLQTL